MDMTVDGVLEVLHLLYPQYSDMQLAAVIAALAED